MKMPMSEAPNSKYKMFNPRGDFSQSKVQQLISKAAKVVQQRIWNQ